MWSRLCSIFRKSDDHIVDRGICFICGNVADFQIEPGCSLRESTCPRCGGNKRNRDLAKVIVKTFLSDNTLCLVSSLPYLEELCIYEAQARGPVHRCLSEVPKYTCSEFFENLPLGSLNEKGIRCENVEALTFSDDTFDLIITQDVFEHVKNPEKAFKEIKRVLKPGGYHIFTVPYHEGRNTVIRAKNEDGKSIFLMPPVYHLDPLREDGSLVYTDFGEDIIDYLARLGLPTEIVVHEKFYSKDDIPFIADETSYRCYLSYKKNRELLKYFLYNSVVFRSKKTQD